MWLTPTLLQAAATGRVAQMLRLASLTGSIALGACGGGLVNADPEGTHGLQAVDVIGQWMVASPGRTTETQVWVRLGAGGVLHAVFIEPDRRAEYTGRWAIRPDADGSALLELLWDTAADGLPSGPHRASLAPTGALVLPGPQGAGSVELTRVDAPPPELALAAGSPSDLGDLSALPDAGSLQGVFAAAPTRGADPDTATVWIMEFGGYACPFTERFEAVMDQVLADPQLASMVRLGYRQYPLAFHPHAREAARGAWAAHMLGGFWGYHSDAFALDTLDHAALRSAAIGAGLDVERWEQMALSDDAERAVERDIAVGDAVGVQGTPNSVVNGRTVAGAQDFETIREAILVEDAAVRALVDAGIPLADALEQRFALHQQAATP